MWLVISRMLISSDIVETANHIILVYLVLIYLQSFFDFENVFIFKIDFNRRVDMTSLTRFIF